MRFFKITHSGKKAPEIMSQFHSHEYYELDFLLKGERAIFLNSKLYKFGENSVAVTLPFQLHKFENKAYERILLCVSDEYISPGQSAFLHSLGKKTVVNYNENAWGIIVKILKRLLALYNSGDDDMDMKITLLLGYLFFVMHSAQEETAPAASGNHAKASPITLKVVDYINTHLCEPISLDLLCNKFYVSKSWLNKNFNKDMNCSVIDYYIKMKINRAKSLVAETSVPFHKIAAELGFSSANYFSIIFKHHVGYSPQQYRNNHLVNRKV